MALFPTFLLFFVRYLNTFLQEKTHFEVGKIRETKLGIKEYSRLQNKHRATLINFCTFFQGLRSLLERVMHIIFQNMYLLFYGMGDAYFKGYA